MAKNDSKTAKAVTPYAKSDRPEGIPEWAGIMKDFRIWYWTGGKRGQGERIVKRGGSTRAEAEARLKVVVADIVRGGSLEIDTDATWGVLLAKWVEEHDGTMKEGTFLSRKSVIDSALLPAIRNELLVRTSSATLAKVIDFCRMQSSMGISRYKSVTTTLRVVADWAVQRNYLVRIPFGHPEEVSKAIADGGKRLAHVRKVSAATKSRATKSYTRDEVPTWDEVQQLAKALTDEVKRTTNDAAWARRAGAAVRVAAGTGLRQCELLSLAVTDVDLQSGFINLWRQIDRYESSQGSSSFAPLKGSRELQQLRPQRVRVWREVKKDLELLVRLAGANGELFPMPAGAVNKSVIAWWEQRTRSARASISFPWKMHMLRHHYGSYSTASRADGGMGMSYATLQQSMGHSSLKTTMDTYIHDVKSAGDGWVS